MPMRKGTVWVYSHLGAEDLIAGSIVLLLEEQASNKIREYGESIH